MIFSPAHSKKWLNRFLADGFAHCKVVIHKPGYFMWVDPRISYTEIEVYANVYKINKAPSDTHIAVRRLVDPLKHRGVFRLFTCVEQVKAMLGISKWWIVTPKQLYKELRNG